MANGMITKICAAKKISPSTCGGDSVQTLPPMRVCHYPGMLIVSPNPRGLTKLAIVSENHPPTY